MKNTDKLAAAFVAMELLEGMEAVKAAATPDERVNNMLRTQQWVSRVLGPNLIREAPAVQAARMMQQSRLLDSQRSDNIMTRLGGRLRYGDRNILRGIPIVGNTLGTATDNFAAGMRSLTPWGRRQQAKDMTGLNDLMQRYVQSKTPHGWKSKLNDMVANWTGNGRLGRNGRMRDRFPNSGMYD